MSVKKEIVWRKTTINNNKGKNIATISQIQNKENYLYKVEVYDGKSLENKIWWYGKYETHTEEQAEKLCIKEFKKQVKKWEGRSAKANYNKN